MKTAQFMRIVARLSLLFAVLDFLFAGGNIMESSLAYIWFCCITFVCSSLVNKNIKLLIPGIAAEFVPFIFVRSSSMLLMYLVAAAYCIYYILKATKEVNYGDFYGEFIRSLIFFAIIVLIALSDIERFNTNPAFYIMFYLVDSIMLMRLLRNMEFNKENKYIMKQNAKYGIAFIAVAFLLSLNIVREYTLKLLSLIWTLLGYVAFGIAIAIGSVFYIIYLGIFYLLRWMAGKGGVQKVSDSQKNPTTDNLNSPFSNIKTKSILENLLQNKVFVGICALVIVIILVVIFIKLFKKKTSSSYFGGDIVEEKEYIKDEKNENSKANNIWLRLKPKNYSEQIRYNYYKFLKFCEKFKIGVGQGDTTLDVNNKAYGTFNDSALDGLRSIYIKARYSDKKIDRAEAHMSTEYYKELKSKQNK